MQISPESYDGIKQWILDLEAQRSVRDQLQARVDSVNTRITDLKAKIEGARIRLNLEKLTLDVISPEP